MAALAYDQKRKTKGLPALLNHGFRPGSTTVLSVNRKKGYLIKITFKVYLAHRNKNQCKLNGVIFL